MTHTPFDQEAVTIIQGSQQQTMIVELRQ